jgi:hypothetical protein
MFQHAGQSISKHLRPGIRGLAVGLLAVCVAQAAQPEASAPENWQAESNRFLLTAHVDGGVAPDNAPAFPFPRSYLDSGAYWAEEVCHWPARDCVVEDHYELAAHTLLPAVTPAGAWQVERVEVHYGSNLYDVALWQLAVMLGVRPSAARALAPTTSPAAMAVAWQKVMGPTHALRNNAALRGPAGLHWRMIAPAWLLDDPLARAPWSELITARGLPPASADYRAGRITWNDWQPVIGENAWARLIGPLQAARLHYTALGQSFVPLHDEALQLAIEALPLFVRQQAANGACYFSATPVAAGAERAVSIENNLSLYAGLQLLRATLRETQAHAGTLAATDTAQLQATYAQLEHLLEGSSDRPGLEAFLRGPAWNGTGFHTTGWINPGTGAWRVVSEPRAVDVQTWGIAALGARRLDAWHGAGTALKMWQSLKAWGGYGEGRQLLGVGFSDVDGNGRDALGHYRAGVLSSEWTAGAIDAVRTLRSHYAQAPGASPAALAELAADESSMQKGFARLRIDRYAGADFAGAAVRLRQQVPAVGLPWLYASRRYAIPFGWVANPLPSTCATAWALLLDAHYDPFGFAGQPN